MDPIQHQLGGFKIKWKELKKRTIKQIFENKALFNVQEVEAPKFF